jgi:hypothetical protein
MKAILATSNKKEVRESIKQGNIRYLLSLQGKYMIDEWNPQIAITRSKSLNRMILKIKDTLK